MSFVLLFCFLCCIRVFLFMHINKGFSCETPQSWHGVVLSRPLSVGKTVRLDALVVDVGGKRVSPFKTKVILYRSSVEADTLAVGCGSGIAGKSRFKSFDDPTVKSSYRRYLMSQDFKSQTFLAYRSVRLISINAADIPVFTRFKLRMSAFRIHLLQTYSRLGISGDNLAVVCAMTLGERSFLDANLREAYSVSGASHVLALSGLHLGIIYSILLMLMCRKIQLYRWRLFSRFVIILTLWGYVMLVGAPMSAVRSASMLTFCTVVSLFERKIGSLPVLFTAALLIVFVSPVSVFDVGFLMSVLSVASIQLFSMPLYNNLMPLTLRRFAPLRRLGQLTSVSVAAQIGVSPLTAYCFGRLPCYFIITNIIAVPLATLLLYLSFLLVLTSCTPVLQEILGMAVDRVAWLLNGSLRYISALPDASISNIRISGWQTLLLYIGMATLYMGVKLLWRGKLYRIRYVRYPSVKENKAGSRKVAEND